MEEVLLVIKKPAGDGMTKVVVIHDMAFAQDMGDRFVMMDEGKIVEADKPAGIFTNPRHERTQAFLLKRRARNALIPEQSL